MSARLIIVAVVGALSCNAQHDVELELPHTGRTLTSSEAHDAQSIADAAFRDVRARLDGLPSRLTLIVRWGKDVIPETGENGTASYPGNVMWTIDPDRDVLATIRTQLRPTLFHELHHLARESRVRSVTLVDHVGSCPGSCGKRKWRILPVEKSGRTAACRRPRRNAPCSSLSRRLNQSRVSSS